jgi:hypothetical protein
MARGVQDSQGKASGVQILTVLEKEVRFPSKSASVLFVDAHGRPRYFPHFFQRSDVVHVPMGHEDVFDPGPLDRPQDLFSLGCRIDDHPLPGMGTDQTVAIVLERPNFQSFQFHFATR